MLERIGKGMIIPIPQMDNEQSNRMNIEVDDYDWVKRFLHCPPWTCECGLINFGRNKKCADFSCKRDRPASYIEPTIDDPNSTALRN